MKASTPMTLRRQLALGVICIFTACLIISCASPRQRQAVKIGRNMDDAEQYLEEYGNVNISVPLLSKMGTDFKFDLDRGSSNYYADAKTQVQGGAASFQQTVNSLGIDVQAQMDPTIAAAYAAQLKDYFSSLQRYDTKQNLQDQAAQAQLQANFAAANTNTSSEAKQAAIAQALQAYSQQYAAGQQILRNFLPIRSRIAISRHCRPEQWRDQVSPTFWPDNNSRGFRDCSMV